MEAGGITLMSPWPLRRRTKCGGKWYYPYYPCVQGKGLNVEVGGTTLMSPWPTTRRTECGVLRDYTDFTLAYKKED